MPLWPAFCGGAYTLRGSIIDTEACINLFPETIASKDNAKQSVLYGTPGVIRLVTATDVVCRGMFFQDGRTFTVIGPTLYEAAITGTSTVSGYSITLTSRGTVLNDGLPVFFASNGIGGNQLALVSQGTLYILNLLTSVLSASIALPLTNPAGSLVFQNGYFLLAETGTVKVWFSELEDGTLWNGLDFFARSNTSDNVIGIIAFHDNLKVWGSKTSEFFYNAGEADNPFLPYPGTLSMDGAVSQFGVTVIGEQIVWLSKNEWDVARVMSSGIGDAAVISTPAVEFALAGYPRIDDVEILGYEQEGHPFVAFTFPTADVTWVYDFREKAWHQRDSRDSNGLFHRWRARGVCAPGGQATLVGDYQTGDIHLLTMDQFDENCRFIRRLRRAPYLGAENQWMFLDQVELGLQAGVGRTVTPNPTVRLRISRDFGTTYNNYVTAPMGAAGFPLTRALWRRLGRTRADQLVLEVSQIDAVRAVYGPGLWIRGTDGSGQL